VSAFYNRLQATATRLIAQYGKSATLETEGAATGPEWDPQPGAPVLTPITVVETGYSLTNRNETLIQSGDWVGIADSAVAIKQGAVLLVDGRRLQVVEVQAINPGGTVLLYEVVGRA